MDKKTVNLYNAAVDVVNFCYDADKGWIGTETIRRSGKFLALVAKLVDACENMQPTIENIDLEQLTVTPDPGTVVKSAYGLRK